MRAFMNRFLLGAPLALFCTIAAAQELAGGTTTVVFDPGFTSLLTGAEITPSAIAPSPALGVFPITMATPSTITHSGGILFSGMNMGSPASLAISDFVINLTAGDVTGDAVADGKNLGVVPLFTLVAPTGTATAGLDLSSTAIGAINTVFGTTLDPGASVLVGEATVKGPSPVPEPSAFGLALLAALVALLPRWRRAAPQLARSV